jgi:hypothetical protein
MLNQADVLNNLQTITRYCKSRFTTYYESDCFKGLKSRIDAIDDAIDLRFKQNEAFIAEIAPPVVRKDYLQTSAFLNKYFENDPIVTVDPIGETPKENADMMQTLLNCNFISTRFREECVNICFDNNARYGTMVGFTQFSTNYRGVGMKTEYSDEAGAPSPYPRNPTVGKCAAINYPIHPLNYFQSQHANTIGKNTFRGFIDEWYVFELILLIKNEHYLQEQLLEAIEKCKKGTRQEHWYGGRVDKDVKADYGRSTIHPLRIYTLLNFEGNEGDPTIYYVELIDDKVIRCEPNSLDENLVPLNTGYYFMRPDTWWGNSSTDTKIQFQNLNNWLFNSAVESFMKQEDRMILTRRGSGLDVADINNRHQNSGIVFYEGNEDPSKLMFPVQFNNPARPDLDWLNRELKQMIQDDSPVVNMMNKYNEGGLNNNTLGAAQMVANIGETMFVLPMKNTGYFIERMAETCAVMLTQFLGDRILIREQPTQNPIEIAKRQIIGEFVFKAKSTLLVNEKTERVNTSNIINQVLNWGAVQNPQIQAIVQSVNIPAMIEDWIRAWVGWNKDTTRYFDRNKAIELIANPPPPPQITGAPGSPPPPGGLPAQNPHGSPPPPAKPGAPVSPGPTTGGPQ